MKSRICLIRHGITEGNKQKLYYGHADIPLAEEGIEQLRELAASGVYPDGGHVEFYTTGLLRTEQTLEVIYGKRDHGVIKGLMEMNFGDFEMRNYKELRPLDIYQRWIADKKGTMAPPNGESLQSFYKRVARGFDELKNRHALNVLATRHRQEDALTVVVCHGGSISAILESIYPREKDNFYMWIPDPGHGYILHMEDGAVGEAERF